MHSGPSARDVTSHHYRKVLQRSSSIHSLAKMADGENKRAELADAAEPLVKRPRLLDSSGDSEHSAVGGTEPVEVEPALLDESHQASVNNNNNRTEPGQTAEPEPELSDLIDEGVHPNGFTSPDLLRDDDDCSSRASSSDWTPQPQIGSYRFIQQHIMRGTDPRAILKDLLPETILPPDLDDMTLWQIIINISEPPKRKKRKDINTLEDVVRLLNERKKILVLTGAGVSVSCGIPDFRSRDGIYARLAVDFPDLPDPQAMFDIDYFRRDPRPFFKFAKEIYPGQFQPSPCHRFISMLDKKGRLLRNYTQNIDTLEQAAGIQKIIQCHGSFATASCLVCKHKVDCEAVREDIFNQDQQPKALCSSSFRTSQYLFQAPNRYIFHGAEVYSSSEDETSSSCGSDSDGSRCSADAFENEDSDGEEDGAPVTDKDTDGLAETLQDTEHKRLQTDCTAETDLQTTQ
ncbi:NAD-dependent protein deacetylase sirtuin-1 [Garra rufa]|uniref:NAD-dependent protein deacetylase sirtuin-1 n=1 Tax=Garra rufa TaxID=137080 RepID=UPI003CCEE501